MAAEELRLHDDELDDLHVCLTSELVRGSMPLAAAIEMGLIDVGGVGAEGRGGQAAGRGSR